MAKASSEASQAVHLRIGINLGDIIIEPDGDIYGDGVNVAARLEQIAEPGGVWISGKVYEEVRGKLPYHFEDKGEQWVKNIGRPVRVLWRQEFSIPDRKNCHLHPIRTRINPPLPSCHLLTGAAIPSRITLPTA